MLSDKRPLRLSPKKRATHPRAMYPDSVKHEAVQLYLVVGNLRQVSAALNVDYETLRKWKISGWWKRLTEDIRTEGRISLTNKLKKIVSKSLDVLEDRLEFGDWVLDQKTGTLIRKPVSATTAINATQVLLDRQMKLEQPVPEEENNQQVMSRLHVLAEAFAQFARKTTKVEVVDAIYEERSPGLFQGEAVGAGEEAGAVEGKSCEEPGTEDPGERDGGQAWDDACGPQEGSEERECEV